MHIFHLIERSFSFILCNIESALNNSLEYSIFQFQKVVAAIILENAPFTVHEDHTKKCDKFEQKNEKKNYFKVRKERFHMKSIEFIDL